MLLLVFFSQLITVSTLWFCVEVQNVEPKLSPQKNHKDLNQLGGVSN